jgi:uncharacterized cupredoxin-like copper-binding protein
MKYGLGGLSRSIIVVTFGGASLLAGCGADPTDVFGPERDGPEVTAEPTNKITGSVREWRVDVSENRAYAGDVTFAITNFGTVQHEFLVVKTDVEPGKIELNDENRFDEENPDLKVIDEIAEFEVNTTGLLKVSLEPGKYQLLCNIAGHYAAGMWHAFEVVEGKAPPSPDAGDVTDADAVSNDIGGSVTEWNVNVDAAMAYAGDVKFAIENRGSVEHEFLVVKTTYEVGKIPVGTENKVDEEDPGITVIDEIPEWSAGQSRTLGVTLEPGQYELLCNIEGHYANGMHAAFEVVDAKAQEVKNDISASVQEWAVHADGSKAAAGDVTFTVENKGTIQHEFLVVRNSYGPGKIPIVEAESRFSEEDPGITVIDEIPEWAAGETKTLTVKLQPGKYELVCNIKSHYGSGMWLPFEVVAA